tara:strand:+ start:1373 stop:2032 length:660 start_codon:yes stop_codon:yes gene_type:complete
MGCNCGKNKNTTKKNLAKAFNRSKEKSDQVSVDPDSMPQIQEQVFRDGNKTVIRVTQKPQEQNDAETSTPEPPSFGRKIANFTKAMASRATKGKASEQIVKLRQLSCHGNGDIPPCPYRGNSTVREGFYFCTACGCGDKPMTWLNDAFNEGSYTKLDYPWVSCPVRNPGFGDYKSYDVETEEDKKPLKEGMNRKKIIEAYLQATGEEIPDHPPAKPNGD